MAEGLPLLRAGVAGVGGGTSSTISSAVLKVKRLQRLGGMGLQVERRTLVGHGWSYGGEA